MQFGDDEFALLGRVSVDFRMAGHAKRSADAGGALVGFGIKFLAVVFMVLDAQAGQVLEIVAVVTHMGRVDRAVGNGGGALVAELALIEDGRGAAGLHARHLVIPAVAGDVAGREGARRTPGGDAVGLLGAVGAMIAPRGGVGFGEFSNVIEQYQNMGGGEVAAGAAGRAGADE